MVPTIPINHYRQEDAKIEPAAHPVGGPVALSRNPTTGFLTATTLIYAVGAVLTAAAGTRLALQPILVNGFEVFALKLQDMDVLYCYFLPLSPSVRIGQFACLLSLDVVAVSRAPSPCMLMEQTLAVNGKHASWGNTCFHDKKSHKTHQETPLKSPGSIIEGIGEESKRRMSVRNERRARSKEKSRRVNDGGEG